MAKTGKCWFMTRVGCRFFHCYSKYTCKATCYRAEAVLPVIFSADVRASPARAAFLVHRAANKAAANRMASPATSSLMESHKLHILFGHSVRVLASSRRILVFEKSFCTFTTEG